MQVVLSVKVMLVDLSVAVMLMTISVAIMQLEVSVAFMQVTVSTVNMWVTIFIAIMQVGVCCNYADDILCSSLCAWLPLNYTGNFSCYSYESDSFK